MTTIKINRSRNPLTGIEELDYQRCPKCNEVYDYLDRLVNNYPEPSYFARTFERQKHICKKNEQYESKKHRQG